MDALTGPGRPSRLRIWFRRATSRKIRALVAALLGLLLRFELAAGQERLAADDRADLAPPEVLWRTLLDKTTRAVSELAMTAQAHAKSFGVFREGRMAKASASRPDEQLFSAIPPDGPSSTPW